MTVRVIPRAETIFGDLLREHPELVALDVRVAGRTPDDAALPWVRVTQLNASDVGGVEHLIDYLVQFDCYAGGNAMKVQNGQAEAWEVAEIARAVLHAAQGETLGGAVIAGISFQEMLRLPDPDFEKTRERVVLTASIHAHAA